MSRQKMKPKYKALWLRALEGNAPEGVYEQGRGRLLDGSGSHDKFCCLGVLWNTACEAGWVQSTDGTWRTSEATAQVAELSYAFRKQVGLNLLTEETLAFYNDHDEMSFAEIAAWIRREL
jgi:hypothetical protein